MTDGESKGWMKHASLIAAAKPTIETLTALLSIAGVLGFLLSIILNTIIFSYWGVRFLAIASPSDVLMSGLSAGLAVLLIICLFFFGLVVMRDDKISSVRDWFIFMSGWLGAPLIVASIVGFRHYYPLMMVASIGGYLPAITRNAKYAPKQWPLRAVLIIALAAAAIIAALSLRNYILSSAENGLIADEKVGFRLSVSNTQCRNGEPLWAGDRTMIVRCNDGRVMMIDHPQGAAYGTI